MSLCPQRSVEPIHRWTVLGPYFRWELGRERSRVPPLADRAVPTMRYLPAASIRVDRRVSAEVQAGSTGTGLHHRSPIFMVVRGVRNASRHAASARAPQCARDARVGISGAHLLARGADVVAFQVGVRGREGIGPARRAWRLRAAPALEVAEHGSVVANSGNRMPRSGVAWIHSSAASTSAETPRRGVGPGRCPAPHAAVIWVDSAVQRGTHRALLLPRSAGAALCSRVGSPHGGARLASEVCWCG